MHTHTCTHTQAHIVGGDSTSVDGVKLKQCKSTHTRLSLVGPVSVTLLPETASGGSALQRLRTRTVNLFRDGRVLGQGGGGEETKGKNGKARTTLPRLDLDLIYATLLTAT